MTPIMPNKQRITPTAIQFNPLRYPLYVLAKPGERRATWPVRIAITWIKQRS